MICFLALFALFGSIWGIELSVGKDAEVNLFEADCTIIDIIIIVIIITIIIIIINNFRSVQSYSNYSIKKFSWALMLN